MPTRTGTAEAFDGGNVAAGSSRSVTVPADCNLVVAFWAFSDSSASGGTLSTLTLNGVAFTIQAQIADGVGLSCTGVATLVSPATGSQTLAWAYTGITGTLDEGGEIAVVYVKDANTADPVRASNRVSNSSGTNTEVALATETTDLLLAMAISYGTPVLLGTCFIDNFGPTRSQRMDVSEVTPSATTTTVTMTGESFSTMAAISLKAVSAAAAGYPWHTYSQLMTS